MFAALKCLLFGHVYGKWHVRGNGGYERRDCKRCDNFELKGRGDLPRER
jgi:hypothetical protein